MIKPKHDCKKQFHGTRLGKKYDIFHFDYVLKIKEDNGVLLNNIAKTTVELEEREAAVAVSQQKVKEVSAAIVASDTVNKEDNDQLAIVNTQLREIRTEEATVSRKLLRYKTEKSNKEKGEHDEDHIDWKKSTAKKKSTKQKNHNFVWDAISRRFESIDAQAWKEITTIFYAPHPPV